MGTDIHIVVEALKGGRWTHIRPPKETIGSHMCRSWWHERNYNVFAVLADVRNGTGFAGCDRGDRMNPIAEVRGLPSNADRAKHDDTWELHGQWLGEHSFTWYRLDEILKYNWDQVSEHRGVIAGWEFMQLKKGQRPPNGWSGWVSGRGIEVLSPKEFKAKLAAGYIPLKEGESTYPLSEDRPLYYVQVAWKVTYRQCCSDFLQWAESLPKLIKVEDPCCIRLIMGFDS